MSTSFPKVVRIEPASACNLRCIHCPTGTLNAPRTLMSADLFDLIESQLKNENISVFVLYHGGEPFLNKNIFEFIERLRRSHPASFIKTVSNGMLLDDETINNICQSSLDQIEFSLDGLSPDDSSQIRRRSDASQVIQAINQLLRQMSDTGSSLKVSLSTTQFFTSSPGTESPIDVMPNVPEWLIDNLKGVDDFKAHWAMVWPRMRIEDGFSVVEYENQHTSSEYNDNCSHLAETITIRANGDVVPCCYDLMSDLSMGNILNSTLTEIWSSIKYNQLRESIASMQPVSTCANCNVLRMKKRYLVRTKSTPIA